MDVVKLCYLIKMKGRFIMKKLFKVLTCLICALVLWHKAAAALDKDDLHAVLPVQCHLREVPRDGAGIDVKWKTHGTVLLCFLQKRWISHVCFLLMIGLNNNLHCLGKILHVLCGIS